MTKQYTFQVKVYSGSDEFWETDPSDKEVTEVLRELLFDFADDATENVTLMKMETL